MSPLTLLCRGLRPVAYALLAAVGFVASASADDTLATRLNRPLVERQPLVVGVTDDSFPYGYIDEKGEPVGFSADLLFAVGREMNLKFVRVAAPGKELHERFRTGEFDLLQSYSQTPDREPYTDFSVPFLTLQGTIYIRKSSSPIRTLDDFKGRKFAIIGARSIAEKFLRDHRIAVVPVTVSSSEEALQLVSRGECDGTFVSHLTAFAVIERRGIHDVKMFGQPFADYDIRHCYAVHKGDAMLLARLNEGLAILHKNGEYDRIYRKWFGQLGGSLLTREQVVTYGSALLALGFIIALAAYLRQRALRTHISLQAAELASQQALLQALYDNIPLGICVLELADGQHRVLAANRQAEPFLGLKARKATGKNLRELPLENEWAAHLNSLLSRHALAPGFLREEHRLATARKNVVFTAVPLDPGKDGCARLCILAEDVTERRSLDEEIAQSRKLRAVGELVGGIAHEFNNLLTPVLLKASEIKLDWPHDQRLHREVGLISSAALRAAELTRRLLTFGRKTEQRIESVQLAAAVDSSFALLRLTVDRRIQWVNTVPPNLPPLQINTTDLNQILINLILNARDTLLEKLATSGSSDWAPIIRVEAVALPADARQQMPGAGTPLKLLGWQKLTVHDNGLGISAEVQERIFEPFYTTKEVGQGTGLGLATVWHLVHVAGGRIEVESVPGKGSAFHVFLPVVAPPSPVRSSGSTPSVGDANHGRIFLAEDDDLVAQTVTTALVRNGHEVHRESDGAAAWVHLQHNFNRYELVILDVNMPGLTGIELTQRIRASNGYPGPIMVISGRLGSADMELLTLARVTAVLTKPFDLSEFQSAVRRCVTAAR